MSDTPPCSVELEGIGQQILENLLQTLGVGRDAASKVGSISTANENSLLSLRGRNGRPTRIHQVADKDLLASTVTVPDSIFDRSRMSLIKLSKSVPAPWIVRANSICLADRLPSGLSPSC